MLIAKGYSVAFLLESGAVVRPSRSYAILHDPSGIDWSSDSVLVANFTKGGDYIEDDEAEEYFGYEPCEGKILLPPRGIREWRKLGTVEKIDYTRTRPERLPASYRGRYDHVFGEEGWIFKGAMPPLYKRGRLLRLEFPEGCELNWRGFCWP